MLLFGPSGAEYLRGPAVRLSTRNGQDIPNERRMPFPRQRMDAARDLVLGHHISARLRSLSSEYDCMGLVFAARRTWIEIEHLPLILAGDEYRKICDPSDLQVGDLVVYRDAAGAASHVGIIASIGLFNSDGDREIRVLSQWGADGEYFHNIGDVNHLLGSPVEFWTDRS